MKILPEVLHPPARPTARRHEPVPAGGESGYQQYRACLRWDFGFTCPFCLLHESDLLPTGTGVDGSGLTSIEHRALQRDVPERRNDYGNCLYACRYCNRARSTRLEQDALGSRLLDPTREAWASHFSSGEDTLKPRDGDRDAHYTCDAYDLNDARKVQMRRNRREWWEDRRALLREGPSTLNALLTEAGRSTPERAASLLSLAEGVRRFILGCRDELEQWAAIPVDAPSQCRCGSTEHQSLPEGLAVQMVDVDTGSPV